MVCSIQEVFIEHLLRPCNICFHSLILCFLLLKEFLFSRYLFFESLHKTFLFLKLIILVKLYLCRRLLFILMKEVLKILLMFHLLDRLRLYIWIPILRTSEFLSDASVFLVLNLDLKLLKVNMANNHYLLQSYNPLHLYSYYSPNCFSNA